MKKSENRKSTAPRPGIRAPDGPPRCPPPGNFLGLPPDRTSPGRAKAWILPVPYEATTCYGAGTRDGPPAILAASLQVEWFDREFGCEPALESGFHTLDPLPPVRQPEAMVACVADATARILEGRPRPRVLGILGGEHSLTPGAVRGVARALGRRDLVAVQIDAHADLRSEYEGSPHSHACAARRILDVCPLFQIGVRSLSAGEERFRRGCRRLRTVFAEEANEPAGAFLEDLADFVRGKTAYLTVDLDGLDPSIMPATGTPEPGGLSWERTLDVVRTVCRNARRVPVFDVVELAPIPGQHGPDFLAALLAYKIATLALRGPK